MIFSFQPVPHNFQVSPLKSFCEWAGFRRTTESKILNAETKVNNRTLEKPEVGLGLREFIWVEIWALKMYISINKYVDLNGII